jgi:hypothetical protein
MAIQFNYLLDQGAYVARPDGTFTVDLNKIKEAVQSLDRELLMIEARGDYQGAKKLMTQMGVIRPEVRKAFDRLKAVPTDIEPQFVGTGADEEPKGRKAGKHGGSRK